MKRWIEVVTLFSLSFAGCVSMPANDAGSDAGRTCSTASDCASGEICVFDAPGCNTVGACRPDIACGRVSLPYCGCNGVSFFDHCAGAGSRWVSMGQCPDPFGDAGADASVTE